MKEMEIQSIHSKKLRFFGKSTSVVYPNWVNRQFQIDKLNRLCINNYYLIFITEYFN